MQGEPLEKRELLAITVASLVPTPSGFVAQFSQPIETSVLNLYDAQNGAFGAADVTLVGSSVGRVAGTLVVQADKLSFVATGGPLPADTYTVTLHGAASAIKGKATGDLLDGNGDGTPGGDYVSTFSLAAPKPLVVSLPDFARGPGQAVRAPAQGSGQALPEGLPVQLDSAAGVTSLLVKLRYDPALLSIRGASLGADAPAGSQVEINLATPGEVTVGFISLAPLVAGKANVIKLDALVPDSAEYGSAQVLDITEVVVNAGAMEATADDAVHVVAYPGDVNKNRRYELEDARLIARVAIGLDSGFVADPPQSPLAGQPQSLYPTVDPLLLGDVTGKDGLTALDASDVMRMVLGLSVPNLPALPAQAPVEIRLSGASVLENSAAGTAVGSLSSIDPNAADTHTYSFAAGQGDTDNGLFTLQGNQLKTSAPLDFETKNSYSVRVRSTDQGGLFREQVLTITVGDVNEAPTGVTLANATSALAENTATASRIKIADLQVADDALGTNVLSLSGADAASFEIDGSSLYLKAGANLNYEAKTSYTVTIAVNDASVGSTPDAAANFTLNVSDVNEAPTGVTFANTIATLAESTATTSRIKVADIQVADDALGTNALTLAGADAASFEIEGTSLYLKAAANLDYEAKASYNVAVVLDDASVGSTPDATANYTLSVSDVNEAPTGVTLANATSTLAENAATTSRIKIADLQVADDALGTNALSLSGADAASFEIEGTALYLKAGVVLNFEAKTSYTVTVAVNDASVGTNPDATVNYTLSVSDVNEAPTGVTLANATSALAENTDTTSRIKVADIVVADDALGNNTLSLSGADAASFKIEGTALYLKAGVGLNFEAKTSYAVTVEADDATVGSTPDVTASFTLSVSNVNEVPTAVTLTNAPGTLAENTDTTSRVKLADIVVADDALGTNALSLSGADAASFEIEGTALYLKAGVSLDYEAKASYTLTVLVDDAAVGSAPDATANFTLAASDVNEAPSGVTLANTLTTLAESTATTSRIKVADLQIADDALGNNTLSLAGSDAASFEIEGTSLYLKAGASFDYETKPSYAVTVVLDDASVGSTPDATASFTLSISDVNEAPTALALANATGALAENTDMTSRVKLADIQVADDSLGTNALILSGPDAASFEIEGTSLCLKAGASLDYEAKASYAVTVAVNDTSVGTNPDATASFTLAVSDVNEAPTAEAGELGLVALAVESSYSFQAGDFHYADADSNPLSALRITDVSQIPAAEGVLYFDANDDGAVDPGEAVLPGSQHDVVLAADIARLKYRKLAAATQDGALRFKVSDGSLESAVDYLLKLNLLDP